MGHRRLADGDEALFELSGITKNEWHALWIGISLGLITGKTQSRRVPVFMGLYSLFGSSRAIGIKTIVSEPWWFLVGLSISYVLMTD